MKHMESKVVLKTNTHNYELSSLSLLTSGGVTSTFSLIQIADLVYDKSQRKFVKCRYMNLDELNEMLELTRG
jgi:hypothetical protein